MEPVPDGWLPDPDSDHGSIHPGCQNILELRQAVRDQELVVRGLHGEFD